MALFTAALAASLVAACLVACASDAGGGGEQPDSEAAYALKRRQMVDSQIRGRGIRDPRVLAALEKVPRHRFVSAGDEGGAYGDHPLSIGSGQTISQPYIVAYMTEALALEKEDRVLEIGTGSGYQAAVLGELVAEVYTIEIIEELATKATNVLADLGYANVHVRHGDGYQGWPEHAPFDAVIVTAAPDHVPQPLVEQLKMSGRIVVPVGRNEQDLLVLTRTPAGLREDARLPVRFVPLTRKPRE
jgi:protein-L-isoaspartate(D-aspartate) O-methyltransferase